MRTQIQYCEVTGKAKYDKKTALTAANKRWADDHIALRIYPCPACIHWHLTKQTYERKRLQKNI